MIKVVFPHLLSKLYIQLGLINRLMVSEPRYSLGERNHGTFPLKISPSFFNLLRISERLEFNYLNFPTNGNHDFFTFLSFALLLLRILERAHPKLLKVKKKLYQNTLNAWPMVN